MAGETTVIIRHKFRNKVYLVFNYRSRRWRGETQDPTDKGKAIKIPMTTGRLIDLDTTIHVLWRLGWRKIL